MAIIPGIYASSISGHLQTGNFFLISQLTPSAVSTVTFSSIPSTYKHLMVRFNLICSAATIAKLQLNGDTGANYVAHFLEGNGSAVGAGGWNSGAGNASIYLTNNGTVSTVYPYVGIIDIFDYANTSKNKTVKTIDGVNQNTSAGNMGISSGVWLSTTAINSLTLLLNSGTFTGTISLYASN